MSPMAVFLQTENSPTGYAMSANTVFWATSSFSLGSIASIFLCGFILQVYGRKPACILTCVPMSISWIIVMFYLSDWSLILSRILAGMTCSCVYITTLIYVAETSDASYRGAMSSILYVSYTLGLVIGYTVGGYLDHRLAGGVLLLVSLGHILAFILLPETPVYQVKQGRIKEAKKALGYFRSLPSDHKTILEDVEQMQIADEATREVSKLTLRNTWRNTTYRRAMLVTISIDFFGTMNGGNLVVNYVSLVFDAALGAGGGKQSMSIVMSSIITGIVMLCASFVLMFTIDKYGRKPILGISHAICAVTIGGLGTWFYLTEKQLISVSWLPLVLLGGFVIFNIVGVNIAYMACVELLPFEIRGFFVPVISIFGSFLSFIGLVSYNPLTKAVGVQGLMWAFAAINIVGVFFYILVVPETTRKSLEQIKQELQHSAYLQVKKRREESSLML